jgi:hypothetical protein
MEIEKGKTFKYLKDKRDVPPGVKNQLKEFTRIKRAILDSLKESDLTIDQLTQKMNIPKPDVVYLLMSLIKFGFVETGAVDDMDEYYTYKLKSNGNR